jgi:hypothetical protein
MFAACVWKESREEKRRGEEKNECKVGRIVIFGQTYYMGVDVWGTVQWNVEKGGARTSGFYSQTTFKKKTSVREGLVENK